MSTNINIYALVNPINNKKFYIGATKKSLEERLRGHVAFMRCKAKKGYHTKLRSDLYWECVSLKKEIRIVLLEEVDINKANDCEMKWYLYYSKISELYQRHTGRYSSQQHGWYKKSGVYLLNGVPVKNTKKNLCIGV